MLSFVVLMLGFCGFNARVYGVEPVMVSEDRCGAAMMRVAGDGGPWGGRSEG